jgi:hypothetical protein
MRLKINEKELMKLRKIASPTTSITRTYIKPNFGKSVEIVTEYKTMDFVILKNSIKGGVKMFDVLLLGRFGFILDNIKEPVIFPKNSIKESLFSLVDFISQGEEVIDILADLSREFADDYKAMTHIKGLIKDILRFKSRLKGFMLYIKNK